MPTMSASTDDVESFEQFPRKRTKLHHVDGVKVEWLDENGEDFGTASYIKTKKRRAVERKNGSAATKRSKAAERRSTAEVDNESTGVGKRTQKAKPKKARVYDDVSSEDELMEWTMPIYVQQRRKGFDQRYQTLKEGGLQLAPLYDDIHFSEDEGDRLRYVKEKPDFTNATALAPYRDIELPFSAGIIPAPIAQYLRDYQVKGAAFLHEMFVYQKGGILGDDMGLGKTIQVIAFLTAAYGKTGDERDSKRMRKMRRSHKWYPKTLIICPGSLMSNWKDELDRWGWWHADIYHGSVKEKEAILASAKAGMLEVMITTYNTYRLNRSAINMIEWDCVVADECHIIKERKSEITKTMNEVNALCRIGLTGTAIQNKYEELWTLLNWTNPGRFGPISTWKAKIAEPLKLGQSHNATVYELARARQTARKLVENLLPQFFLRRMKTLIKDQLPKKSDRVVFCPLTPIQASAYENFLDSEIVQLVKNANEICHCGSHKKAGWCCKMFLDDGSTWQTWVFPAMITLQKLANHLALLIPQGNDSRDRQAKDLNYLMVAVPDKWKSFYSTRDSMIHQGNPEYCGKWRILRKLLQFWYEEGGNKVLVFSHSVRFLQMLQRLFDSTESRYNVAYLDGSMKYEDRYAAVQNFNADPMQFVFLISTKAGGVGLNITSANKVVIVDPNWNPSYDLQAQDRAYRIGQTRDVEVFRLVSQGTIEEVVYARQIYKQQQANIGYTGSNERRYFQGVQDRKDQKGEIFGLSNLFAYENENVRLRDIVNKTNVAESRAGVRFHSLEIEQQDGDADDDGSEDMDSSQVTLEDAAMSQMAAEIKGEDLEASRSRKKAAVTTTSEHSTSFQNGGASGTHTTRRHDPVQAILASAGVSYTHENSEVIGSSRVEAHLSRRAEESGLDTQQQNAKVFVDDSQSQARTRSPSGVMEENLASTSSTGDNLTHGAVHLQYRPPTAVKQRQFCSMTSWAGYGSDLDAVINFALFVEACTQAERRELLDRFYAWREGELLPNPTSTTPKEHDTSRDGHADVDLGVTPSTFKQESISPVHVLADQHDHSTTHKMSPPQGQWIHDDNDDDEDDEDDEL